MAHVGLVVWARLRSRWQISVLVLAAACFPAPGATLRGFAAVEIAHEVDGSTSPALRLRGPAQFRRFDQGGLVAAARFLWRSAGAVHRGDLYLTLVLPTRFRDRTY